MSSGSICTVNTAFSVTGPLHSLLCRSLGMDRCTLTLITSRPDLRRNAARVAVFQGADRSLDDDAPALLDLWPTRDYTDPRRAHRSISWRNDRYASSRHYAAIRGCLEWLHRAKARSQGDRQGTVSTPVQSHQRPGHENPPWKQSRGPSDAYPTREPM